MIRPASTTARLLLGMLLLLGAGGSGADPLQDFGGAPHALAEYTGQGKWLVVMIWASDCPVCNAEVHQYNDFYEFHHDDDAGVLGISVDGPGKLKDARAFVDRHAVAFPNLVGDAAQVAAWYQRLTGRPFVGTPTFLIYSPGGELAAQQVGAVPRQAIEEFIRREAAPQSARPAPSAG
jgi:peroxiredoxin